MVCKMGYLENGFSQDGTQTFGSDKNKSFWCLKQNCSGRSYLKASQMIGHQSRTQIRLDSVMSQCKKSHLLLCYQNGNLLITFQGIQIYKNQTVIGHGCIV